VEQRGGSGAGAHISLPPPSSSASGLPGAVPLKTMANGPRHSVGVDGSRRKVGACSSFSWGPVQRGLRAAQEPLVSPLSPGNGAVPLR